MHKIPLPPLQHTVHCVQSAYSSILSNHSDVLFSAISLLPFYLTNQTFVCGLFHICVLYHISLERVVSGTLATDIFDCVIIASSLKSIRPGLVHGCKAPHSVG